MMALRLLGRASHALLACSAGSAMLVMVVLTFVDVIGRYGFHASVFGASEMVSWLMVVVIFGGIAFVTREDSHISVGLLEGLLTRYAPDASRVARHVFTLVAYALVVWILWRLTIDGWQSGRSSAVLGIPLWSFAGMGALLSSLGLIGFLSDLIRSGGRSGAVLQSREGNAS